jgi:hypothetical protein
MEYPDHVISWNFALAKKVKSDASISGLFKRVSRYADPGMECEKVT